MLGNSRLTTYDILCKLFLTNRLYVQPKENMLIPLQTSCLWTSKSYGLKHQDKPWPELFSWLKSSRGPVHQVINLSLRTSSCAVSVICPSYVYWLLFFILVYIFILSTPYIWDVWQRQIFFPPHSSTAFRRFPFSKVPTALHLDLTGKFWNWETKFINCFGHFYA